MPASLMTFIKQKHVMNKSKPVKKDSVKEANAKLIPQLLMLTSKLTDMVKKQVSPSKSKKKSKSKTKTKKLKSTKRKY